MAKLQAAVARGVNDIRVEAVFFPGGAMVKNSHRNGFFQPKNAAERETIATGIPPTFIARLYPVDLLGACKPRCIPGCIPIIRL